MHRQVTPQDFPDGRWHGHWIWVAGEELPRSFMPEPTTRRSEARKYSFRKTFHLDQVPERAPCPHHRGFVIWLLRPPARRPSAAPSAASPGA